MSCNMSGVSLTGTFIGNTVGAAVLGAIHMVVDGGNAFCSGTGSCSGLGQSCGYTITGGSVTIKQAGPKEYSADVQATGHCECKTVAPGT